MALSPVLAALQQSGTQQTSAQKLANTQNTFMRLMATQLRHQNPLSPMKSAQLGQQIAAFATVQETAKTNALLTQLIATVKTTQSNPANAYLGKVAVLKLNNTPLSAAGNASWRFDAPGGTKKAVVEVLDAKGKVLKTETFTPPKKGANIYVWKGPTDAKGNPVKGEYTLRVKLTDANGQANNHKQIYSMGTVTGVEVGKAGILMLRVNGRLVNMNQLVTKVV